MLYMQSALFQQTLLKQRILSFTQLMFHILRKTAEAEPRTYFEKIEI